MRIRSPVAPEKIAAKIEKITVGSTKAITSAARSRRRLSAITRNAAPIIRPLRRGAAPALGIRRRPGPERIEIERLEPRRAHPHLGHRHPLGPQRAEQGRAVEAGALHRAPGQAVRLGRREAGAAQDRLRRPVRRHG